VKAGAVDIVRHWQELGYLIVYVTGRPDMQLQRVVSWLAQHNFPHGLVSFADGFRTDPLGHKAEYLKSLVDDQNLLIHAAYGSSKDVGVYSGLGMRPEQIYVVGKASKKQAQLATVLSDGYADHLAKLSAHGGSRKAQGNARMVIPKTNFGLPGQNAGLVRRRTVKAQSSSAKRTTSFPLQVHPPGPGAAGSNYLEGTERQIDSNFHLHFRIYTFAQQKHFFACLVVRYVAARRCVIYCFCKNTAGVRTTHHR
jgi:hypothetical protein